MKKIITLIAVLAFTISVSFAQETKPAVKKVEPKEAPAKKAPAKDIKETPAAPAQHLKKDGTPDMRYKENKDTKPADGGAKKEAPVKPNDSKVAPDKGMKTPPKK